MVRPKTYSEFEGMKKFLPQHCVLLRTYNLDRLLASMCIGSFFLCILAELLIRDCFLSGFVP